MIREYAPRPAGFAKALQKHGLFLAAFAYGSPLRFTNPDNRQRELSGADEALQFVAIEESDRAVAIEESYALSNVSSLTIAWRTWSSFFMRAETALHACNTVP